MIKWGIVGAGYIAKRFVKGLSEEKGSCLYAIACRNAEKLEAFKEYASFERGYLSYEDLLNDPNVDAVYISLPNELHYEWVIKALKHKKAVLCEKPATVNVEEIEKICACAKENNAFFMEAMKSRFIPMYRYLKTIINSDYIGKIKSVDVSFCIDLKGIYLPNLYNPIGGGCLLDTGIYVVAIIQDFLGDDYNVDNVEYRTIDGVLSYTKAALSYKDVKAYVECAFDCATSKQGVIVGELGTIVVDNFYRPQTINITYNTGVKITKTLEQDFDDFYPEIAEVSRCIELNKLESNLMPHNDSIACAKMIENINKKFS